MCCQIFSYLCEGVCVAPLANIRCQSVVIMSMKLKSKQTRETGRGQRGGQGGGQRRWQQVEEAATNKNPNKAPWKLNI